MNQLSKCTKHTVFKFYNRLNGNGSNVVFPCIDVTFVGKNDKWRHPGGNVPDKNPKWAWIVIFRLKSHNLKIAITPKLQIRSTRKLKDKLRPTTVLRGWFLIPIHQSNMADGRHFEKYIWRHNSTRGGPIWNRSRNLTWRSFVYQKSEVVIYQP